jgi:DNA invertase Pin-like site-specific DNA recombinase
MKERHMEGIRRAKENGVYKGRKPGSSESSDDFLN